MLEASGRTIALSLTQNIPLGVPLSLSLIKRCLGLKNINMSDLAHFDSHLCERLSKLLTVKHSDEFWTQADIRYNYHLNLLIKCNVSRIMTSEIDLFNIFILSEYCLVIGV